MTIKLNGKVTENSCLLKYPLVLNPEVSSTMNSLHSTVLFYFILITFDTIEILNRSMLDHRWKPGSIEQPFRSSI